MKLSQPMSLGQIQRNVPCTAHQHISPSLVIDSIVTDSRKVTPGCLFIAIIGEKFDAHDFLDDVIKQGAAAVLVERMPASVTVPALVVKNTRVALGEIAHAWRSQFNLPVIGVTGSNGKTTVKEMIASILVASFGVEQSLATQGNLNNDIGVPQTLFRLNAQHRAAVVELGMNHPGEIAQLAALASPTVGLVNNAQREHQEFMQSVEAVARENGAVISALPLDGVAVFPAGDTFTPLWRTLAGTRKVLTFGLADGAAPADISASYQATEFGSVLQVTIGKQTLQIQLAAAGAHNVLNALAAIATCHAIGCDNETIVLGLQNFKPVSGRLQKKRAYNGAVIIDDTYNANPDSVRAAIHVLAQAEGCKILVLGDMGEVGSDGPAFHVEIGAYAKQHGISLLVTLGQLALNSRDAFGHGASHFEQIEPLLKKLDECVTPASTVLVKGSRFMKMERVVAYLMNTER
jgi:UDP-N-acetylmuramoyl-tripeptide--D-alanyl-D-alanine ligase